MNNAFALDERGPGHRRARRLGRARCPISPSAYKDAGIAWVAIGDENYGEGSSREHAAMEPRYMSGRAVIVRSFARIHEANLKKQGVLALTFANPDDYEQVQVDDTVDIVGLADLAPGRAGRRSSSTTPTARATTIATTHTMSDEHIDWFRAGSALNVLRGRLTRNRQRTSSGVTAAPRSASLDTSSVEPRRPEPVAGELRSCISVGSAQQNQLSVRRGRPVVTRARSTGGAPAAARIRA